MKKENFVKIISEIQKADEEIRRFDKKLGEFFDSMLVCKIGSGLSEALIDVIEDEMEYPGVSYNFSVISWWLYDAPKAGKSDSAWIEDNGIRYDLPDAEALYKYLDDIKNGTEDD